jgi:quinoprotein glucose dehydrogenase
MGTGYRGRLDRGEQVWQVVNGDTPPAVKNHPLLKGVTLPRTATGRADLLMVTKSLLFVGEGYSGQPFFRALTRRRARPWEIRR